MLSINGYSISKTSLDTKQIEKTFPSLAGACRAVRQRPGRRFPATDRAPSLLILGHLFDFELRLLFSEIVVA